MNAAEVNQVLAAYKRLENMRLTQIKELCVVLKRDAPEIADILRRALSPNYPQEVMSESKVGAS